MAALKHPHAARIAGWKEVIDLPEWKVFNLLAKLDTGANSSAIDVSDIEELDAQTIRFRIHAKRSDPTLGQVIEVRHSGITRIRSSNGRVQKRYKVTTSVQIGDLRIPATFTLVCRRSMICRALLGRKALAGAFLIDSAQKYRLRPRRAPKVQPILRAKKHHEH